MRGKIFRAYDVRGAYPEKISEETAYRLGSAFAFFLKKRTKKRPEAVVSRDGRSSSPALARFLIKGLLAGGADVINANITSTPEHCFAVNFLKTDGGAMITASHNPAGDNGFKFSSRNGEEIGEESGLKEIEKIFLATAKKRVSTGKSVKRRAVAKNVRRPYLNFVLKNGFQKIGEGLKAVADAGNGAAALELKKLKPLVKFKLVPLFFNLNSEFPGRGPNPLKKGALTALRKKVLETKADLGTAFDADGDRSAFVDEKGKPARPSSIAALIAGRLLKENPGAGVWLDAAAGRAFREAVIAAGGRPIAGKVGRTWAKKAMREGKLLFGAESSGHYYFCDFFFSDSGLLAFLNIVKIISESERPLSELIKPFEKYFWSGEINIRPAAFVSKREIIERVEKFFAGKGFKISKLDGLSADGGDFWFNLRPSNTENYLRLNAEGKDKKLLAKKVKLIKKLIGRRC